MKIYITLIISILCLWNCRTERNSTAPNPNGTPTAESRNISAPGANENQKGPIAPGPEIEPDSLLVRGNFSVDTYVDDKLESRSFYKDRLLTRSISYDPETKKVASEIKYFYDKTGKPDHQKVISGRYVDTSKETALENEQAEKEFQLQRDLLKSEGIEFPFADLAAAEISDLSNVLSIAKKYSDFETESRTDGNKKTIKFVNFNKTLRLRNSPVAMLIGKGDFVNIKEYELTLQYRLPLKEVYRTGEGELIKTYSYKDQRLTETVYEFTDPESRVSSFKKRFEYHEIK